MLVPGSFLLEPFIQAQQRSHPFFQSRERFEFSVPFEREGLLGPKIWEKSGEKNHEGKKNGKEDVGEEPGRKLRRWASYLGPMQKAGVYKAPLQY